MSRVAVLLFIFWPWGSDNGFMSKSLTVVLHSKWDFSKELKHGKNFKGNDKKLPKQTRNTKQNNSFTLKTLTSSFFIQAASIYKGGTIFNVTFDFKSGLCSKAAN